MSSFTPAQAIASMYHSPGPDGIGFARFASTHTVTPELWDNIASIEEAAKNAVAGTEEWLEDMIALRKELAEEGITEQ